MSNNYTLGNGTITNIANAIRAQEGSAAAIAVSDFANRVSSLTPVKNDISADISNNNTKYYGVSADTLSALGAAITNKDGLTSEVSDFARRILALRRGSWVRPSDWPNYNFVDRTNDDAIYFTVDTSDETKNVFRLNNTLVYASTSTGTTSMSSGGYGFLDRGYIDSSGFHSVYSTPNVDSGQTLPTDEGRYVVYRLKSANSPIACVTLNYNIETLAPIVEVWGRANYAYCLNLANYGTYAWDVICGGISDYYSLKILSGMWGFYGNYTSTAYVNHRTQKLEYVNFDNINWDIVCSGSYRTKPETTRIHAMFGGSQLEELDLTPFEDKTFILNTTGIQQQTFAYMSKLSKFTMPQMTLRCTSDVTGLEAMFVYDTSLTTLDLSKLTIRIELPSTSSSYFSMAGGSSSDCWFNGCSKLTTIYMPTIDDQSGKGVSMRYLFGYCINTTEIYNVPDVSTTSSGYSYVFMAYSKNLSRATMLRFFNAISTASARGCATTIRISQDVANRLSETDIAILIDKGHTLSIAS